MDQCKLQVEEAVVQQTRMNEKPEWMERFLESSFFGSCSAHPIHGNQLNRYCTTCNLSGCQYCMASGRQHRHHDILKIYRHVYQDAVLLSEMDEYLDCAQILPYKSNQSLVIALKPLPHLGGASKYSCKTCTRRVTYPYSYCCLHCKVVALSSMSSVSSSAASLLRDQTSPNKQKKRRVAAKPQSSLHRRKGKPFRAPFF
ncbi:putative transcription repressor PLATZ family [Rosa chinensis]|uniref:Putative transcription repressor PLATZ family n=1 Tax=Rosa chinensis TaxID=74649 RepID=A0A2P6RGG1_ROSCH|nr:putative transcription repressor PLATZ family [Rosa chinensis]